MDGICVTMNQKRPIMSVGINSLDPRRVTEFIQKSIVLKKHLYVCVAAAHLLVECQQNAELREGVNNADLVVPDGMPIVWTLRLMGHGDAQRVYGPDLMMALCGVGKLRRWRIFLLGGAPGQATDLARTLLTRYPGIRIAGALDTPVRPIPEEKNKKIIVAINRSHADIVFVGLGCPEQELWMIRNRKKLIVPALIGVGAAFDFLSGRVRQAPAWIRRSGFEWLFRLIQEPRRLWRRYTVTNIKFVYYLGKYIFGFAR